MISKKRIIEILNELDFSSEDYYVGAGSALVLHGVKEFTKDIDLAVSEKLWNLYLNKGFIPNSNNENLMEISEDIEFIKNWHADDIIMIDNIPVVSLTSLIKQKEILGRDKDFRDIELIKNFITNL